MVGQEVVVDFFCTKLEFLKISKMPLIFRVAKSGCLEVGAVVARKWELIFLNCLCIIRILY